MNPSANSQKGHLHPMTQMIREIQTIFEKIGFEVAQGPELETEFYNFDALNIPAGHPARGMQDTFWIKDPKSDVKSQMSKVKNESQSTEHLVLRTHTSPVQIRYMQNHKPPFKIIVPGKVYRNEATDATHEAQFHQVEGLYIEEKVSLAELKGTLEYFFKALFGNDVQMRFRPSYFPFVEPGVEVDIFFKGRWLEVMGAGPVHENVLRMAGIDPEKYSGYAFGGGIDRLLMIRYGLDDIRLLYSGDLRFVNQF
ncbi:MAG: phenylalanine--tRNA ligase subunit alpha [Candidatus Pacebacteria bacterium]|nr:phenylalanine--tRNA ligase subunit alpha [Candidatus Paceibacterota bacterium]